MKRALPWIVLAIAVVYSGSKMRPAGVGADGADLDAFGKLPAVHGGRVKPLDSFARTMLRVVAEKETFEDAQGVKQPAIRWLLDVMADTLDDKRRARKHRVFRITHPQVQDGLALPPREGFRYSLEEFKGDRDQLDDHIRAARTRKQEGKQLDPYERGLVDLSEKLSVFGIIFDHKAPDLVPPASAKESWESVAQAMSHGHGGYAPAFLDALRSYASGDIPKFNEGVRGLLARVGESAASDARRAGTESFFNRVDFFGQCRFFYLAAFILTCLAWLGWTTALNRSAYRLGWFLFALHTVALVLRIYLSGRPPVTNLYSSAIFIGWGAVLFGLALEAFTKAGVGNLIMSVAGFATLQVAHVLAAEGDTLEVLQAVLDTQFWLATHVTTISLGYTTTYVAGLVGVIYVVRGLLTKSIDEAARASLAGMIYGVTCFSMFFSFVGTVLGGLWADDSWGRFWGWDPKENGALMIVLWNAILLHARWGGLVRERGLALLAVFGNVVVSWSWFGVNELGKGLHTYGFTEGRSFWLLLFCLSQVLLVGAGLLPRKFWASPDAVRAPKPAEPA